MAFIKIKGVIPPMITPFLEDGDLDLKAHEKNVEKWNQTGLAGFLVLGSNSEAVYLNEKEKLELIRVTTRTVYEDKIIIAGTGLESTRETIRLTNKAAKAGAHCALLLTPSYYGEQMGDDAQIRYYLDVADHVDIPVMIYNVAKFTHINISTKAVEILSKHTNIIGMKDSSGNIPQLVKFKSVIDPNEFNLMVGTASAWYPALTLGIEAAIMALANCSPKECVKMQFLYEGGDQEAARELYERMFPVNQAVTTTYGVAGLKHACRLLGYDAGFVRRPLLNLREEQKESIKLVLSKAGVLS